MKTRFLSAILAGAAALILCACGGGIGGSGAPAPGTLSLALTDAPACGFDAVNITVQKVRVHQSATAVDADAGWSEIVLTPARRIDLVGLTNGVLEELGQTPLPAGKYTQMRFVLMDNSASNPLANSVVPTGAAETALTTPSGQQSGIKMNVDIDVPSGKVASFILDFDACKSVVTRGNSGQYNLKPVIAVIPRLSDAGLRVVGYVDPLIALGTTDVSVQMNGVPVKSTPPDSTGKFVLYPVPVGTYDLVVTAPGRVTAVMTGVPVATTSFTNVNSITVPIVPPMATTRSVTGTVTPATASVRALQAFTAGPTVEVQWGAVDATTGAFGFSLPIEAPVKTAYVATPLALNFAADTAAAAKYTLEANSAGVLKTQAINVTTAVPAVTFTFP